jgi:hypothetical protein
MIPVDHERMNLIPVDRQDTRRGVWSERLVVGLLVACLAGTLNLIVILHRRTTTPAARPDAPVLVPVPGAIAPLPKPAKVVQAPQIRKAPEILPSPPPAEDPTKKALAELEAATARELEEARKADRRTEAMEMGRRAAVAESERWRRRESLIRSQVASLAEKSQRIERQVDAIALERDVLAQERDALKAALTNANNNSSFAVLPFKGANGTWQRPIVLECVDGSVTLQPRGITFSMMDLNPHIHPRGSIVVQTIARELTVMAAAGSPDGAPVVPYLVFVIRPDGIRAYYEARARLEPLGISFGYELVPQDLKINFPDLADLETWDGTTPLNVPSHLRGRGTDPSSADSGPSRDLAMNGVPPTAGSGSQTAGDAWASGSAAKQGDRPNDYIWPTQRGRGGGQVDGAALEGALAAARNTPNRGFPPGEAGGEGGHGFGNPAANPRSPVGVGRPAPNNGVGRPAPNDGVGRPAPSVGGSSGIWATPGDGSSGQHGQRSGERRFRSRGAPGGDANGSEFGFGQLPGSAGGSAERRNGSDGSGDPALVDIAGLLEKPPGNAAEGDLDSLIQEWTGNGGSTTPGTGVGSGGSGDGQGSRREVGIPGRLRVGQSSGETGGTPRTFGNMPPELAGIGGGPGSGAKPGANAGPASTSVPGGGVSGGSESQTPAGSMSGLSPSLLETSPPDGVGSGSSGSTSSTSGSTSASGLTLGSQGMSRSSSNASSSGLGFGLPSSLSPSAGASGSTSGSSPSSSASKPSEEKWDDLPPLPQPDRKEPLRIDAAFEVVIDCQRDGIEIMPGGNRLTLKTMQSGTVGEGVNGQELLTRHLRFLERKRAIVDPMIRPMPRVKFIVEPGGDETYLTVRRQLLFSGLDWPMTVQLVEGQGSRFFSRELW